MPFLITALKFGGLTVLLMRGETTGNLVFLKKRPLSSSR